MTFLKHCMEDGLVHIPYDREFMNELNVERFGLEATGKLKFSHPPGTHDDRRWAFALAVYYARLQPTEYHPVPPSTNTRDQATFAPNFRAASGKHNPSGPSPSHAFYTYSRLS